MYPLKQGLKRRNCFIHQTVPDVFTHVSIKTRIETLHNKKSPGEINNVFTHVSIKTRIETRRPRDCPAGK